uniref:Uncharacterized protein n=1 Tax=Anguilla anguilla TaxID=7936 RepID=A0A0E9T1E1_ANGAN
MPLNTAGSQCTSISISLCGYSVGPSETQTTRARVGKSKPGSN